MYFDSQTTMKDYEAASKLDPQEFSRLVTSWICQNVGTLDLEYSQSLLSLCINTINVSAHQMVREYKDQALSAELAVAYCSPKSKDRKDFIRRKLEPYYKKGKLFCNWDFLFNEPTE